eukprot:4725946-Amphidinium_carterae.1
MLHAATRTRCCSWDSIKSMRRCDQHGNTAKQPLACLRHIATSAYCVCVEQGLSQYQGFKNWHYDQAHSCAVWIAVGANSFIRVCNQITECKFRLSSNMGGCQLHSCGECECPPSLCCSCTHTHTGGACGHEPYLSLEIWSTTHSAFSMISSYMRTTGNNGFKVLWASINGGVNESLSRRRAPVGTSPCESTGQLWTQLQLSLRL